MLHLLTPLFLTILELLQIGRSEQSVDFVENKKQFQLHPLITEQRHPKTWDLSEKIKSNTLDGIQMLLSVDEDISNKFLQLAKDTSLLEQAAQAVEKAILEGRKVYIYGCGATGRLAKQMESSFWRPFWEKIGSYQNQLIGEMTGGDRALISSLEGFEDLQLIGKLQLEDHQIQKGDVVFAVTEGGETSSVIGTILAALNQGGEPSQLYFIYNNPDEVLLPFERSRTVIENEGITKIRLFTGPQSITGSTRMQATTSETFVMGIILEEAVYRLLKPRLSAEELANLGFSEMTMAERILSFLPLQKAVCEAQVALSHLTNLEAATYADKRFSTYFAQQALITVFIDSTERAPTFRLFPLDNVTDTQRKSWIQVWTPAIDQLDAWKNFLGRPFYGLSTELYEKPFSEAIEDPYLRMAALRSLKNAGPEQQFLYDFSFSAPNIETRGPKENDLGVMALFEEEIGQLLDPSSPFQAWLKLFEENRAKTAVILLSPHDQQFPFSSQTFVLQLPISSNHDPLKVRQHVGLKMLLNAHSTAVMAKLGRVVGNTMTNVNPGNLKLIGRATFLIQSHVNDKSPLAISYSDANAVLFDAIEYAKKHQKVGQNAEVPLSIIRILEADRRQAFVSWEEAETLLQNTTLEQYLQSCS